MAASPHLRELRLIVASPSDVSDYRDAVEQAVDEFNRGEFSRRGVVVRTWRWDLDLAPRLHPGGPQAAIDEQMGLDRATLLVGIFRDRIGTAGPDGRTGTQHEVERAIELWERNGTPNIALYFATEPSSLSSEDALLQRLSLVRFKNAMAARQIIFDVGGVADFARTFRRHLLDEVDRFLDMPGSSTRPLPPDDTTVTNIISSCPPADRFAESFLQEELARARDLGHEPFWWPRRTEPRWLGNLFAFWARAPGLDAATVQVCVADEPVGRSRFVGFPDDFPYPENTPGRQKVVFTRMSGFTSETVPRLHVAPILFGDKRYVETHWREFLTANPSCSAFGVTGFAPLPSITVVHAILVTRDGWLVLARRSTDRDYFPRVWSASYEEQIDVGVRARNAWTGDRTVGDAAVRGLLEEFGVASHHAVRVEAMCVGRECVLDTSGLVANAVVVCEVEIALSLTELWRTLTDFTAAIDRAENDAWAGLRSDDPMSLADLSIKVRKGQVASLHDISRLDGFDVDVFPGSLPEAQEGAFLWHPSSEARLALHATRSLRCGGRAAD